MNEVQAIPKSEISNIERLLRKYDSSGLYADIWKVGINLALRISDLLALRMVDLIDKDELIIREGKTGKMRRIELNSTAKEIILKRQQANPGDTWLFQAKGNRAKSAVKAVSRESVARKFKEVGDLLGYSLSTHSMRKTRGKALWDSGISIEVISKVLNHSSPSVTMRYIGIDAETISKTYSMEL